MLGARIFLARLFLFLRQRLPVKFLPRVTPAVEERDDATIPSKAAAVKKGEIARRKHGARLHGNKGE